MSVTFAPELQTAGFTLADYAGGRSPHVYLVRQEAVEALVQLQASGDVLPGCTDPDFAGRDPYIKTLFDVDDAPEVNLANTNARMILELLGFEREEELCGGGSGEDLLGRVLLAQALVAEDLGVPEMVSANGRMIECGRRPGYTQAVLADLADLARWAIEHDRVISWG